MSVLTNYKINFRVKQLQNSNYKFMSSISSSLDYVIIDFDSIADCDNILEVIDYQNDVQVGEMLYTTKGLQKIKITNVMVSLYNDPYEYDANPNIPADYSLPTSDFKEIVLA